MQDYLLGDWGGLRTDLANNGLSFELFYIGSMPTNMHGGIEEGTVYQGAMLMIADFDTEKAGLWKGGRLHVSGVDLHGELFSKNHVGDFNKSNLVDFENDFRLWEAYYEQKLGDSLTVKLGLMTADADFILPDFYHSLSNITFLNQTFFFPTLVFNLYDIPGFPVGNHALNSSPYGSLGAVVKWNPDKKFYMNFGIYDGEPNLGDGGTDFSLSDDQGALMFFETGIRWNVEGSKCLPGDLKLGAFYHTDEFSDVYDVVTSFAGLSSGAKTHDGNYGFYALLEQMLVCESGCEADLGRAGCQGLYSFLRFTGAPADRNLTQFGVDGGFVWRGLIPTRDYDTLGIGGSYLQMSDDIRRGQKLVNKLAPGSFVVADYEAAIEVNYKVQLAAWWTIQPSFQYAMHPGGSGEIENAWVFILQSTLRF
ncbi:OprB family porin [Roseimicrobium gellanilyticum]|uniref:OprB family porin n=2 Tax=Roseimicrobium gellanilyticum TaxID=748857 RepID=A0A366HFR1_9BACT|nr:OprB family porin [Roseimicrobium gellanilyticum]